MAVIAEHVKDSEKSFAEEGVNNADGLVFSELCYIKWEALFETVETTNGTYPPMSPEQFSVYSKDYGGMTQEEFKERICNGGVNLIDALELLMKTPYYESLNQEEKDFISSFTKNGRYGNVIVGNYKYDLDEAGQVDKNGNPIPVKQFAAMTFTYECGESGEKETFVTFRGTDNTIEGWYEDFMMAYDPEIPAQTDAVEYLNSLADKIEGSIRMGGHSKGGNLSNYAFLFCSEEVRRRIIKLYSYDGPGFHSDLTYRDATYDPKTFRQMLELLSGTAFAPYNSVVGRLLEEHGFEYVVTQDGVAIFRNHSGYFWEVDENGNFILSGGADIVSNLVDETLDELIAHLSEEERRALANILFEWAIDNDIHYFSELLDRFSKDLPATLVSISKYYENLPEDTQTKIQAALSALGLYAADNVLEMALPEYSVIKERLSLVLKQHNITSAKELWLYLKVNPIENTLSLLQEFLLDFKTLKAIVGIYGKVTLVLLAVKVIATVITTIFHLLIPVLPIVAAVLAVLAVVYIVVKFIVDHWDEIVEKAKIAVEFVQKTLAEFAEAVRLVVQENFNRVLTTILYAMEEIMDTVENITVAVRDGLVELGRLAAGCLSGIVRIMNPLVYGLVRVACGWLQSNVQIDMYRLSNAVNQMERIAERVKTIEDRLNNLYPRLCQNNIEQGEGIFTSLLNLFNLCRADVLVDEGLSITRKANALRELYSDYDDAERWVKSAVGG